MSQPIIGLCTNLSKNRNGAYQHTLSEAYTKAIIQVGALPLMLSPSTDMEMINRQMTLCDGVLLPGGDDVNPILYGEEPHYQLGCFSSLIDQHQLLLTQALLKTNKPLLGICKGAQVLNIACGGNLYQDLSECQHDTLCHSQKGPREEASHTLTLTAPSILYDLFGSILYVNSFHHQALKNLGKDLVATAYAKDGIIEAIEMPNKPFVIGVQWHPESLLLSAPTMLPLFMKFITSCSA